MKKSEEYKEALSRSIDEKIFGNGEISLFEKGYDFAMSQPKHILDGVADVGEVRRFAGGLVDVKRKFAKPCTECVFHQIEYMNNCMFLTGCDINNVKYIIR